MMQRLRKAGDEGTTLFEVLVSMMIFGIVIAATFGVLIQVQRDTTDNLARSESVSQARLGLSKIDRTLRSGNQFYATTDKKSLSVYSDSSGICVQFNVVAVPGSAVGRLQMRQWVNGANRTSWSTIANDLVVADSSFSLTGPDGNRALVDLYVKSANAGGDAVQVGTSLTRRNPKVVSPAATHCGTEANLVAA